MKASAVETSGGASAPMKILVVDNHRMTLNLISSLLKRQGHEVLTAEDGLTALDVLRRWIPGVVFVDLVMPNIGGEKLCRIIRKTPRLKDIFIVVVSAVAAEEYKDVTEFGADTCIAKGPFSIMATHILDVLQTVANRSTANLSGKVFGLGAVHAREITRELLSVKDHFEVVLDRMQEGLLEITSEARVVYSNPTALKIVGKPEEEVLGSDFIALFEESDAPRVREILGSRHWEENKINEEDPINLCGKQITLDFIPLRDSQNKIIVMLIDVTERKRMKVQMMQAMEKAKQMAVEAESANIAKSAFLAVVSHEIRTPMNAVIGFTDMLLSTSLTKEQIEYADIIKQSGKLLLSLISDILDFSRIEAGRLELETIDFDPQSAVYHVCDLVRPQAAEKSIAIICRVGDAVPVFVKGDPGRFHQVLIHLLGNAVKFTDSGEVEIGLQVDKEEPDRIQLHAKIRDTGAAIPKENLAVIFEAFQQGDTSMTRRHGGTGLGLPICRRIAQTIGGNVWAESEPGKGNLFHFTGWFEKSRIQCDKSPAPEPPGDKRAQSIGGETLPSLRILLVEDNLMSRKLAELMLIKTGFAVDVAENGQEAIEMYTGSPERYGMILMDLQMPEIDGLEATKIIRKWELEKSRHRKDRAGIPIVALTANAMRGDREACLAAGMDDYIAKPIQREVVLEVIENRALTGHLWPVA